MSSFCYYAIMFDIALMVVIVSLGSLLVWSVISRRTLRHQLTEQKQVLKQMQQTAAANKSQFDTMLATEQRQWTEKLALANQRFELALRVTGGIFYDLEVPTGAVTWSSGLFTTYGYSKTDAVKTIEWWSDHIHPEDALKLNEAIDQLTDPTATDWTVEYRFRKADNSYVLMQDHAFVLRNDSGEPLHLIGFMQPKPSLAMPQPNGREKGTIS